MGSDRVVLVLQELEKKVGCLDACLQLHRELLRSTLDRLAGSLLDKEIPQREGDSK